MHSQCSLLLQAYDARQAQATMDSFLAFNERFAKIKYALFCAPLMLLGVIKARLLKQHAKLIVLGHPCLMMARLHCGEMR